MAGTYHAYDAVLVHCSEDFKLSIRCIDVKV